MSASPGFRIGELSRRVGVSPELLRAWESRYRLLRPRRTAGGFRLYSEIDEARVRRMRGLAASGLSAAEAARSVLREENTNGQAATVPDGIMAQLDAALLAFDEPGAHSALDRLFAAAALETALQEAILPELRSIGDRWAAGEVSVAQEHFASTLIRGRLLGLARGWDQGRGGRALLACAPGELHDIGLISFGLVLHRQGWRIVYVGQDTPLETMQTAIKRSRADLVVVSSIDRRRFDRVAHQLGRLARRANLAIGGAGATEASARRMRATLLAPDLADAAHQVTAASIP